MRPPFRPLTFLAGGLLLLLVTAVPARALRIVVTNDDGFESRHLQALFSALKAAGHDVILSAPFSEQTGASAALGTFPSVPATTSRSPGGTLGAGLPGFGPTTIAPDQYYVNSTAASAAIYGIEVFAQNKWGALPDLVISGPNLGPNLGTVTPHSGTIGAAICALNRGVPAIAMSSLDVSAVSSSLIADITIRVMNSLLSQGRISLPAGTGINVNVPLLDPSRTAASYRYVFTQINTPGKSADASNPFNEDNAIADGNTITVSPIQGTYQAPPDKAALVLARMRSLFNAAIPLDTSRFANLSVRGSVGAGGAVQIVGLVVSGDNAKSVLIRASGPALTPFGVPGVLLDPLVELYDNQERLVASNDNWGDDPAVAAAITSAATRRGAFAWTTGSRDAALLVTLAPGNHTIVVRGVGGTTGVVLVEAYDLGSE
ncbi:MAG: 5'/3'-nucleotidase SurE [Verrucomicrobia bacterium]|nr:5'/3'-nucleotidase SurE [Verrucomicrobiota bacterium]